MNEKITDKDRVLFILGFPDMVVAVRRPGCYCGAVVRSSLKVIMLGRSRWLLGLSGVWVGPVGCFFTFGGLEGSVGTILGV